MKKMAALLAIAALSAVTMNSAIADGGNVGISIGLPLPVTFPVLIVSPPTPHYVAQEPEYGHHERHVAPQHHGYEHGRASYREQTPPHRTHRTQHVAQTSRYNDRQHSSEYQSQRAGHDGQWYGYQKRSNRQDRH